MIHKAKNLSSDQKIAIESLLRRAIAPSEEINIYAIPAAPEWLQQSWQTAKQQGLDRLSMEEIDAEISAARKKRRQNQPRSQQ